MYKLFILFALYLILLSVFVSEKGRTLKDQFLTQKEKKYAYSQDLSHHGLELHNSNTELLSLTDKYKIHHETPNVYSQEFPQRVFVSSTACNPRITSCY